MYIFMLIFKGDFPMNRIHNKAQDDLINKLEESLHNGHLSHALLFHEQPGSGALSIALNFARMIVGNDNPGSDALKKLEHPDLHLSFPIVLSKKGRTSSDYLEEWRKSVLENPYLQINQWVKTIAGDENKNAVIGKDESQEIIKKLNFKAHAGGYKAMVMWLPEQMNAACANKLLKIIEEPPSKTIFLFISEQPEQLLPTIISRTQVVKVPQLSNQDVQQGLEAEFSLSGEEAATIAGLSEGNFARAISLANQEGDQQFYFSHFVNWMRNCYGAKAIALIDWAEEIGTMKRTQQKSFLIYAMGMFRNCILNNFGAASITHANEKETAFLNKFQPFINNRNIEDLFTLFNQAHYHIDRNGQAKLIFLNLSFKVANMLRK